MSRALSHSGLRPVPPPTLPGDPAAPLRAREARIVARLVSLGATPRTPADATRGPRRPTPRPRGAHCRAPCLTRGYAPYPRRRYPGTPPPHSAPARRALSRALSHSGLRPVPPPTLPGDPAAPLRAREARIVARLVSLGATPRTPADATRGPRRPTPRPRGAHCRAPCLTRGYAPYPRRRYPGTPPPHSAPARRALSRLSLRSRAPWSGRCPTRPLPPLPGCCS